MCLIVSSISEMRLMPFSSMNFTSDWTVLGSVPDKLAVIVHVSGGVEFLGGETISFPEK